MFLISLFLLGAAAQPHAALIQEDFTSDPLARGWNFFGEPSLFQWNAANQNLQVTWDSAYTNSYFYMPLGNVLTPEHDFRFSADLVLQDIEAGVYPGKEFAFEISFGLLNWSDATRPNFLRGTGSDSPNVVEFTYFPDTGWGATISPVMITASNQWAYGGIYQELTVSDLFHVDMIYASSNHVLTCHVTRNGQPYATGTTIPWDANFSDFRVDTFCVNSYSDLGAGGSILAHGTLDNLTLTIDPPRLAGSLSNNVWRTRFATLTNYTYHLQGSTNLTHWSPLSSAAGNGGLVTLAHTNASPHLFFRVLPQALP